MADKIIPRSAARLVELIPQLSYCNPFLAERNELDKKALGSDYKDTGRDWNVHLEEYERDPYLKSPQNTSGIKVKDSQVIQYQ